MTEDTTQFITTLGDGDGIADARIISGGTSFEIVPNVNMSKWDDEAFLNINKKDFIVSKSTLTDFIDGRLILQNSNEKWQTYIKDGKQEIEVVYPDVSSVPNIIELDLLYPDGLNFFYQGPLSQEAIKKGNERPENVVGSYAALLLTLLSDIAARAQVRMGCQVENQRPVNLILVLIKAMAQ